MSAGSAMLADMATPTTARERLRELVRDEPDLTATEVGRRLGISRQRAQLLADEEGLELAKYTRGSKPLSELSGTTARARRTLESLRAEIAEAKAVEKALARQVRAAGK